MVGQIDLEFEVEEGFEPVANGRYLATLEDIQVVGTRFGDRIRWIFRIEEVADEGDEDAKGKLVTGMTSTKVTPRSKAFQWFKALGGKVKKRGDKKVIDLNDVIGNMAIVEVENRVSQRGLQFSNVVAVHPYVPVKKGSKSEQ